MFSAQFVPSPVDRETEEQVVMRKVDGPITIWRRGNQPSDDNSAAYRSTHVGENNRLSTGGKRATLRECELAIWITDPDLE